MHTPYPHYFFNSFRLIKPYHVDFWNPKNQVATIHTNKQLNWTDATSIYRFFFNIIGQNPSVSNPDRFHVVIFRLFFIDLRYILLISFKQSLIFMNSWTSTGYFSNSTGSSGTSGQFSHKPLTRMTLLCMGKIGCRPRPLQFPNDFTNPSKSRNVS